LPFRKIPTPKIAIHGWLLMEVMNPVDRKLFLDFLRKEHPDAYELLIKGTATWQAFKDYYAYLLQKYWKPFNKWVKSLGFKTPHEKLKERGIII